MTRFRFRRVRGDRWTVASVAIIPGYSPDVAPYRWVDLVTASRDASLPAATRNRYATRARHVRSVVGARGGFGDGVYQVWPLR